jgi:serine/threonine protein kinase
MTATTDRIDGRYRLVRLIGRGGMADVYEAIDEKYNATVAIKFVRSPDPELATRFAREIRALGRVEHPGMVRMINSGVVDGHAYLVMDMVAGPTLAEVLRQGPLGPERTADLGVMLASALAYIHGLGIVHRDVKPSNILFGADGRAQLGDFGVARLLDVSAHTLDGTTLGTASYMAPEQLEDHQVGGSADIWSLGLVLLECLTGRRAYEGSPTQVVAKRMAGPVPIPDGLTVAWTLILPGMLDPRPDRRLDGDHVAALLSTSPFRSPGHLSDPGAPDAIAPTAAFEQTVGMPMATATATTPLVSDPTQVAPASIAPPPRSRRRWLAALAAAVVVALVIALLVGLGSSPSSDHGGLSGATPPHRTSTTTTKPSTTTTLGGTAGALAQLERDVSAGVSAGTIEPRSGQAMTSQAQQAVSDAGAGKLDQAANDVQRMEVLIADDLLTGTIDPSAASTLQSDLAGLTESLGLNAVNPAPTTPTTPGGPAPGPGHGNGGGKGNGNDN